MRNDEFDEMFKKRSSQIKRVILFAITIKIVIVGLIIYAAIALFSNPEKIGEFYGKIYKGFATESNIKGK